MTDIRDLVRTAWHNAKENGYGLDPDDEQEAINLADKDVDIERWVWFEMDEGFQERFDKLKQVVKELRKEFA